MEWFGNLFRVLFNEDPLPTNNNSENDTTTESSESKVANEAKSCQTETLHEDRPKTNPRKDDLSVNSESELSNVERSNEENLNTESFQERETIITSSNDDCTIIPATEVSLGDQETRTLNGETSLVAKLISSEDSAEVLHETKYKFNSLLSSLGLNPQEKFTLKKALTVDYVTFSDEALTSPEQIPKYILQKLMIVDYNACAFKLDTNRQELIDSEKSSDEDDGSEDEDKEEEDEQGSVNPMDAFLALFHCCDDFLRQDLVIKLSACQLSVPFLLPDPDQPAEKITMLLWALEGIKKSWKTTKDGNESDRQAFVMGHPFPIVSFIRVGENGMSKSRLLNEVISDLNGHRDFFFHKDCKGGGVERVIVDGLVELCWYLPGGRKKQAFEREVCFANFRGDARKFSKQFSVLLNISSAIFVLLPSTFPDKLTQKFLTQAMKAEGKLIFVFNTKREKSAKQYFDDLKSMNQDKFSTITRAMKKNEDDFVVAIRGKVQKHAEDVKPQPLKDLSTFAKDNGIDVDNSSCETKTLWNECVTKWFKEGPKKAKTLLKLQSEVPTIANLERENVRPTGRGNKSEEEYSNEIHNKLQTARERQKKSLKELDEDVRKCLNYIPLMNESERNYSLTILKHDLDRMSLDVLTPLQADYRQAWLNIVKNKAKQKNSNNSKKDKEQQSSCKSRLKDLEEAIKESSFGLEHIFREMAQIFQRTEISINNYSGAAANILLSGRPLELMDGDSSYIPLKWFNAVFEQLKSMTKNANIFVISVLGIQSSGKSTMLNTMFGLEFPVSAGRCTRGAFASLIPLGDSLRHKSKYDYILIIDTEGLRGSAETQLRQHDNELATFAIGVADLTIVNIFGENYNEMKEFLEIAVHAFLKMKLVNEKRICQIVHQNVAAIDASNKLATERMILRKKLDEMTKLAAIQENCENEFEELNDVLAFDENEGVSYIPSMWQGCPPMAPMNPEYGKAVQKVREKIMELMCSPERTPLFISQFQKRVNDLWSAILRENFIFSFRNTIEVRAYTSLDQKLFEESVKTMVTKLAELEKTTSVLLMRSPAEHRENIWEVQKLKIRETADELSKKMESEMEVFFETNEDKATLEQWRENTMIKIQQLRDNQENEVKRNCKAVFDHLQSRQEIDKMKLVYKTKLLENAKTFITSVEANDDVDACENIFEEEWTTWIGEVPENNVTKVDVRREIIDVLCHTNRKFDSLIHEKCKEKKFDIKSFGNSLPSFDVNLHLWERMKNVFHRNPQLVQDARIIQDNTIASAIGFAERTQQSGTRCRKSDLQQLYAIVPDMLNTKTEKQPFTFKHETTAGILLYCFGKAYPIFHEMEEKYYRENDIKLDLETNLKPDLKKYFLNQCKKMRKEVLAADSFVDVVKNPILLDINQSMGPAVANELLKLTKFQSKGQFHAKVLMELGDKKIFSAYVPYLQNPVAFLQQQLQKSIVNYCIIQEQSSVISLLKKQVENKKQEVFSVISNVSRQVSEKGEGIYKWIEEFIDNCSTLAITQDMFSVVTIDEELKDFEVFENQVKTLLTDVFQNILDRGVDHSVLTEWKPQPFEKLVDLMFGCDKCCPFCKALCDQTLRNHDCEHSTRNHRPQGITGYRYYGSNVLVTTICTTSVAGKGSFKNFHTSDNWHPYEEYQTVNDYYRSWSIAPDSSFEASSYWKWFIATYSNELAEHYQTEKPDIPTSWKDISFDEAKEQIRKQYNLA